MNHQWLPRPLTWGMLVLVATLAIPSAGARADEGTDVVLSDGVATAAGMFVTYQDREFIIPGGTFPPPDIAMPWAAGGIDLGGTGTAVGAMGYSPYVELFGAINSVAPPGSPPFPAETVANHSRASVAGQPPKSQDASTVPDQDTWGAGTARAALGEGPTAEALGRAFHLVPANGVSVAAAASEMRVSKASGVAVAEAVTRLQDVRVNDALTIESIVLRSSASADGGDGVAESTVTVHGVRVGGIPVRITGSGLEAADQAAPFDTGPLEEILAQAGIRLVAPGSAAAEPGGRRSATEARGPELRLESPNGERLHIVLGRATAVATAEVNDRGY